MPVNATILQAAPQNEAAILEPWRQPVWGPSQHAEDGRRKGARNGNFNSIVEPLN